MRFRYSCLLACFIFGRGRQSRDKKTVMGISPYTPPPSVGPSHTPLRPPHPNHSASFGTHCLVESQMPTIGNGISVSSFWGAVSIPFHPIPSHPPPYGTVPCHPAAVTHPSPSPGSLRVALTASLQCACQYYRRWLWIYLLGRRQPAALPRDMGWLAR